MYKEGGFEEQAYCAVPGGRGACVFVLCGTWCLGYCGGVWGTGCFRGVSVWGSVQCVFVLCGLGGVWGTLRYVEVCVCACGVP